MGSKEELRRQGVPEDELDDVIELAARLQTEAGKKPQILTADEAKAVAGELDIDARYVEEALAERERRKRDREAAAQAARARQERNKRTVAIGAAVLVAVAGLTGWSGASSVGKYEKRAERAKTSLNVVLDRQAALLPQLVAISGGDAGNLGRHESRLRDAGNVRERLAASQELSVAMASRLGKLAQASDPSTAQQRLSLHHELVGAQNRITTEQRRYEEALTAWESAASSFPGRVAIGLGMARAPRE